MGLSDKRPLLPGKRIIGAHVECFRLGLKTGLSPRRRSDTRPHTLRVVA